MSAIKKPMLAAKIEPGMEQKLQFPLLATPKIDGIRAIRVGNDLLSRNLKPIPNVVMRKVLTENLPEGADGEITLERSDATFQDVTAAVMTKKGSEDYSSVFRFYWFDYCLDPKKPYTERVLDIKNHMEKTEKRNEQLVLVPLYPVQVNTLEELLAYEKQVLQEGFEGVMLRKADSPYKFGKSTFKESYLLKMKRFDDAEAIITDCIEKMSNTNEKQEKETGGTKRSHKKSGLVPAGTLGAFVVENPTTKEVFNIGSGFTDAQRMEFWKAWNTDPESMKGLWVKYKFFAMGSKDAPRFPVFLGFRDEMDFDVTGSVSVAL